MNPGLRLLKLAGESGLWKHVGRFHGWLYRSTGGKIGHSAGGLTNLLLITTGRKSGAPRRVTLTYIADGDAYVVVASNGGADRHPSWWLNLAKTRRAKVQVGDRTIEVVARQADPQERARLWPKLKQVNPFYGRYEQITDREIPVVILTPARG
jgi:F420H(2)-dependent quinone reductase